MGDCDQDYFVYRIRHGNGFRNVLSPVPNDICFNFGLAREAVMAVFSTDARIEQGEPLDWSTLVPHPPFIEFMHHVISVHAPDYPLSAIRNKRVINGWLYLLDARTPTPTGEVPPEDILGAFRVEDGALLAETYKPNHNHRILGKNGISRLEAILQGHLIRELSALCREIKRTNRYHFVLAGEANSS